MPDINVTTDMVKAIRIGFKSESVPGKNDGRLGKVEVQIVNTDIKSKIMRNKKNLEHHSNEDLRALKIFNKKPQDQINQEFTNRQFLRMIPGGSEWYIAGNGQLKRQTRFPNPQIQFQQRAVNSDIIFPRAPVVNHNQHQVHQVMQNSQRPTLSGSQQQHQVQTGEQQQHQESHIPQTHQQQIQSQPIQPSFSLTTLPSGTFGANSDGSQGMLIQSTSQSQPVQFAFSAPSMDTSVHTNPIQSSQSAQ